MQRVSDCQRPDAEDTSRFRAARARALSEASRLFTRQTSSSALLQSAARRMAMLPGDACIIHVLTEGRQSPIAVAAEHRRADARGVLQDLLSAAPQDLIDAFSLRALQAGQSILVPLVTSELMRLWTPPKYWPYLERFNVCSVLVTPMRAHGRNLGTVRLWREHPRPAYTRDDAAFVQSLVNRIAFGLSASTQMLADQHGFRSSARPRELLAPQERNTT